MAINPVVLIMKRLRILHILPKLTVAGAEKMAASLMVSLARSHDMAAISLYGRANSTIEAALDEAGIPVWYLDKRSGFDPAMFRAINKVIVSFQPDVVHSHLSVLRYAMPSLILRNVPLAIHTVHNMAEHEADRIGRMINKIAFKHKVVPVGISEVVGRSIEKTYGEPCRVMIPNGIPVEKYGHSPALRCLWRAKEALPEDAVVFTFVGRLETQKNPMLLVEAFRRVTDPRSHLVFIGCGTLLRQLEKAVSLYGLEKRVHFLGERMDIADALASADVFVLGSDWEGNPLSVMEAMAAGLPVIATRVGGVPELVENAGILIRPGDAGGFAGAMEYLLNNPQARADISRSARARAVARFRVEQMVEAYEALYRSGLPSFSIAPQVVAAVRVKSE